MLVNKFNGHYNLNQLKHNQNRGNVSMRSIPVSIDAFSAATPQRDKAIEQLGPLDRITMHKLIDKIQLQGIANLEYPNCRIYIKATGHDEKNIINKLSYNILTDSNHKDIDLKTDSHENLLANGKIIKDTLGRWYVKPELLPSDEINLNSYISEYNYSANTRFTSDGSIINTLGAIKEDLKKKIAEGKESKFAIGALGRIVDTFSEISQERHNKAISYGNELIKCMSSDFSSQITLDDLKGIMQEYAERSDNPTNALSELQETIARIKRVFNPPHPEKKE